MGKALSGKKCFIVAALWAVWNLGVGIGAVKAEPGVDGAFAAAGLASLRSGVAKAGKAGAA